MRLVLMLPLFCPFGFIPSSFLYEHKHTPVPSHHCLIHPIYSFSLYISLQLANIHTEHSASPSLVAPARLSHLLSFLELAVLGQRALEMLS